MRVLQVAEEAHRAADRVRGLDEELRRLLEAGPRRRDLVEDEAVRGGVHEVEDVVERLDEGVDVLAVDRRDPRAREEAERLVGDLVALVLEVLDPRDLERDVREVGGESSSARAASTMISAARTNCGRKVSSRGNSLNTGPPLRAEITKGPRD